MWSGRADLNRRPLQPHCSALTWLRHVPSRFYYNASGRTDQARPSIEIVPRIVKYSFGLGRRRKRRPSPKTLGRARKLPMACIP